MAGAVRPSGGKIEALSAKPGQRCFTCCCGDGLWRSTHTGFGVLVSGLFSECFGAQRAEQPRVWTLGGAE